MPVRAPVSLAAQARVFLKETPQPAAGSASEGTCTRGAARAVKRRPPRVATGAPSHAATRQSSRARSSSGRPTGAPAGRVPSSELPDDGKVDWQLQLDGQLASEMEPTSPKSITDSALRKSQLLLDQLLSLDLPDEQAKKAERLDVQCDAEFDEEQALECPPLEMPQMPVTVELPVEMLQMLAEMWEQVKEEREILEKEKQSLKSPCTPARHKEFGCFNDDVAIGSPCSTRALSSSIASSPVSSLDRSTSSLGSPCSPNEPPARLLSNTDKAQLIQELRAALMANLPPRKKTLSPVPQPCMVGLPTGLSPGQLRVMACPQPIQVQVPRSYVRNVVPPRRLAWQPVVSTTIRHVLTAC